MKFGATLRNAVKEEWKDNYIDYSKLKKLLREKENEPTEWTEQDESNFVEELVNVQIEKVNAFHLKVGAELKERVSACESKLEPIAKKDEGQNEEGSSESSGGGLTDENKKLLQEVHEELDSISREIASLYKFARLNFTACLKAAKKHDRLKQYKIRPLVQVRLSALPFSSEDYSPMLYKISAMYAFIRQCEGEQSSQSAPSPSKSFESFESHKFWVHPDNLLEVKTYILRRLPVLIYNPQSSKVAKANRKDPTLTSLYFDNSQFELYTHKLDRYDRAASLRLRWYGMLADKPDISLERKVVPSIEEAEEIGTEERVTMKEKEIYKFISGEDESILEKKIAKNRERKSEEEAQKYEKRIKDMSAFIKENNLQPMLRAVYTRTAFQIPGDDDIRISLDTDLVFIKEDSSSRDPSDWHRHDIDDKRLDYPFNALPKDDLSKFPYALLEIKIKSELGNNVTEWVGDLMNSHLVYEAPRFSKFVHGVSVLFEDNVNTFPFWFGDLDKDIRKDPKDAWEKEQDKIKAQVEELAVGSYSMARSPLRGSPFRSASTREVFRTGEPPKPRRLSSGISKRPEIERKPTPTPLPTAISEAQDDEAEISSQSWTRNMGALSGWRKDHRGQKPTVELPPGITKPSSYIKNAGPLQIEAKVWLANQRTFIKWQHICVLLASLSLALYNAAGQKNDVARGIGFFFTGIALFAGAWGYWMYIRRSRFITDRSEKGFDTAMTLIGPIVICLALILALILNFLFKFRIAFTETSFYIQDLTEDDVVMNSPGSPLVVQGQGHYTIG